MKSSQRAPIRAEPLPRGETHRYRQENLDQARVETQKGKIQISLPRNAAFEIDTDLGRRARLESDFDAVYHARRHSDDIEHGKVNGGGPMLRLSSEKGTIRLRAL